jgi:hypothetical protein
VRRLAAAFAISNTTPFQSSCRRFCNLQYHLVPIFSPNPSFLVANTQLQRLITPQSGGKPPHSIKLSRATQPHLNSAHDFARRAKTKKPPEGAAFSCQSFCATEN